jgi:hypothetical protein
VCKRCRDCIHRSRHVLRRRFVNFVVADGRQNVTGRSWHRGGTRSRHGFIANMSPASAASTALRVNPQGFVIEQSRRGERRLVSGALPPARGIAWLPRLEQPPALARRRRCNLVAHRVASRCCVFRVYIYGIWHCVNSNGAHLGRS